MATTTPLVIQHQGKECILVWGAEHVTIHDATDGKVTWSCGNFNPEANKLWPAIASPVIVGDMVVIAYGRNDRGIPRLHGIRLAGSGDVTADQPRLAPRRCRNVCAHSRGLQRTSPPGARPG